MPLPVLAVAAPVAKAAASVATTAVKAVATTATRAVGTVAQTAARGAGQLARQSGQLVARTGRSLADTAVKSQQNAFQRLAQPPKVGDTFAVFKKGAQGRAPVSEPMTVLGRQKVATPNGPRLKLQMAAKDGKIHNVMFDSKSIDVTKGKGGYLGRMSDRMVAQVAKQFVKARDQQQGQKRKKSGVREVVEDLAEATM
jgi:hypothetical protein